MRLLEGPPGASWPNSALSTDSVGPGGAVHNDERRLRPWALVVDRTGEELLAGTRLSLEKHRRLRGGDRGHEVHGATESFAVAHQLIPTSNPRELAAKGSILTPEPNQLERPIHRDLQALGPNRLGEIVNGPDSMDRTTCSSPSRPSRG